MEALKISYEEQLQAFIKKGEKVSHIAEKCGLDKATVWRVANGVAQPSARVFTKLMEKGYLVPPRSKTHIQMENENKALIERVRILEERVNDLITKTARLNKSVYWWENGK